MNFFSLKETKLEIPLQIEVKVLGIHDPNNPTKMTQVYKNTAHNRSRTLKCSQNVNLIITLLE